jgi:quercetin dioxygenase-like cupin family protein
MSAKREAGGSLNAEAAAGIGQGRSVNWTDCQDLQQMTLRIKRWGGTEEPDPETLRAHLQREGYSVFEWSDVAGTAYGPHSHAEDQSHWIISGALTLTVAGESYTLLAGDRDFLPANTIHAACVPENQAVRYLIGAKR